MVSLKIFRHATPMTPDEPENPWASSGGSRQNNAWNGRPNQQTPRNNRQGGGRNTPPPTPPLFNEFKNMFGRDASPFRTFGGLLILLILLWIASGLYRVQPEENGIILRLGKFTHTITDAGLHYHLPWPIETVIKENVTFERRIEIGYRGLPYGSAKDDIAEESMMLTGDANIVDLDFVVQWKVADAKQFLFNIREPEATLKRVAESAMREVIGQNNLQDIITDRREDIAARVKTIMQEIMDSYGSGIMITQVLLQDAGVPGPVKESYDDVRRAMQEAETMRNQALKYRNEIVPRAQGEAIRMVKEGEGYKEQVVSQAKGDAQRFIDIHKAYSNAKDVTRERLYIEAWEQVLKNNDVVILDGQKNGALPYVNLNELRAKPNPDKAAAQENIR